MEELLQRGGYINADGFITVIPNSPNVPGEGNGLLQTGLYYAILAQYGGYSEKDTATILNITLSCLHRDFQILWRSPWKKNKDDDEQHDDYRGWLAACYFSDNPFPKLFLEFAKEHNWVVDVQNPDFPNIKYYFGRYIGFPSYVKMCARQKLGFLDHITVAFMILSKCFKISKSDSCMKAYCEITVARKESKLCNLVSKLWFYLVRKKYKITGQAFAEYFQSPSHPLCLGDWD